MDALHLPHNHFESCREPATMVEMKREDFIKVMIAELARQMAADENAFTNPPIRNSMEVFRSLCFDFPTVSSDEILALSDAINKIALEKADIDSVGGFCLEEKFLQNLIYLSGSTPDVIDNKRESAVGSLCSAVFINLPLRLLMMTRKELSLIFRDQHSTMIPSQNTPSVSRKGVDSLPWVEVCHKMRKFIMLGTSSLLTCSPTTILSIDSRIGECLESLSNAIKMVRCEKRNSDIKCGKLDDDLTTLHQCFLLNKDLALKAAIDDEDAGNGATSASASAFDGTARSSSSESDSSAICGMAKDIWIHLSFLCRDLFVQHPESLDHPAALPAVLGALIPLGSITISITGGTGPSSSFPTAEECVFALILAGIVTGVVHTDVADTSRDGVSGGISATMIENNRVRSKQRAVRCSKARATLRKHLDSFSPSLLVAAVAICERISSTAASNTNGDGAALLCDIATLYTSETEATTQALLHPHKHPHEHLISSRALSALVCMWIDIVSREGEGDTVLDETKTLSVSVSGPSSGGAGAVAVAVNPQRALGGGAVAVNPQRASGPSASRIMQTLAVLCLQRPLTAAYVLKVPRLLVSVLKVTKQWQSNSSGAEDQRYLMPGDSIGLLIALLLVAEAQLKGPSDVTANNLSESLISALNQLKTDLFSAFAAISKRKDGLGTILPQNSHGSKDDLTQMKRHSTFLAPKGLLQSLRVITSENGGASSLRSSVAMKGKEGGGAGRISAVRALQVWAADILSPPPDRVVKKGLILPALTTIKFPETLKVIDDGEEEKREMGRGVEHLKGSEEEHHTVADDQTIPVETEDEDEGSAEKAGKETVVEEEEEDGGGDIEELRRLVKALQSILQGFTTSKID